MTEELDALKAALRRVPEADPAARHAELDAALENFDRHLDAMEDRAADEKSAGRQETAAPARPIPASPRKAGFLTGVRDMLKSLSPAGLLAGTTSLAALAVAVVALGPMLREGPPATPKPATTAEPSGAAQRDMRAEPSGPEHAHGAGDAAPAGAASETPGMEAAPEIAAAPQAAETAKRAELQEAAPMPEMEAAPAPAPLARTRQAAPAVVGLAAPQDIAPPLPADTEAFANAEANPVKAVAEAPVSTFSVDVDTASYAVIRQSLTSGHLPPKEAVRIEEMVNYFPYAYPAPEGDRPFRADVAVMPTPWNAETRLVRIGLQGRLPALADRPPLNLVFLVDTSGSMEDPAKLPLLKQALRLTLPQLRPEDQVAIVAYAGSAGTVLEPTSATDAAAISAALDRLGAGGSTAGAEGLALAYQVAAQMAAPGEVSRVLLATDGDFNVGISDPQALEDYVAQQRNSGTYLSVLGFGRGNLDDAVMQALAQNGNGMAAYIDTAQEARKVLVDQLSGALFPLADDVKVQVEWNPAQVAEYRLIGYETRALRREDFNNDKVDAGEIGAGHQVTALYEITAPDSPARLNDPLRYGAEPVPQTGDEIGFLRLRWKAPGANESALIETPITGAEAADADARFAAAIAGFGQLLTGATYLGDWGWDEAIKLAEGARGEDPFGYRIEAVNLMRLAQALGR